MAMSMMLTRDPTFMERSYNECNHHTLDPLSHTQHDIMLCSYFTSRCHQGRFADGEGTLSTVHCCTVHGSFAVRRVPTFGYAIRRRAVPKHEYMMYVRAK